MDFNVIDPADKGDKNKEKIQKYQIKKMADVEVDLFEFFSEESNSLGNMSQFIHLIEGVKDHSNMHSNRQTVNITQKSFHD